MVACEGLGGVGGVGWVVECLCYALGWVRRAVGV